MMNNQNFLQTIDRDAIRRSIDNNKLFWVIFGLVIICLVAFIIVLVVVQTKSNDYDAYNARIVKNSNCVVLYSWGISKNIAEDNCNITVHYAQYAYTTKHTCSRTVHNETVECWYDETNPVPPYFSADSAKKKSSTLYDVIITLCISFTGIIVVTGLLLLFCGCLAHILNTIEDSRNL